MNAPHSRGSLLAGCPRTDSGRSAYPLTADELSEDPPQPGPGSCTLQRPQSQYPGWWGGFLGFKVSQDQFNLEAGSDDAVESGQRHSASHSDQNKYTSQFPALSNYVSERSLEESFLDYQARVNTMP